MELEKDVELYLVRKVEALGGVCLKHGQDGWPDRIVMLPDGELFWVELKRYDGELSNLQVYRATQLAKVGQRVCTAWSRSDVDAIIKKAPET